MSQLQVRQVPHADRVRLISVEFGHGYPTMGMVVRVPEKADDAAYIDNLFDTILSDRYRKAAWDFLPTGGVS